MVQRIIASLCIVIAVSVIGIYSMRFIADMNAQVSRVAWINRDIATSYAYMDKAIKLYPIERKYNKNIKIIKDKYREIQALITNRRAK